MLLGTDSTGLENYTFKVDLDDEDPKTFYNLILRKEVDGTFSPPYLKKYAMDDVFFLDYSNGNSTLEQFIGTVENIAIDETIDIDILLERQQNKNIPCIEPITDDGDISNPNDGNGGSTGGGGGGGTSGTGTGSTGGSGTGSGNTGGTGSSGSSDCTPIYDMVLVGYACGDGGSYQAVYQYQVVAWDCPSLKSASTRNRTAGCPEDNGTVGTMEEDAPPCKKFKKLENNTEFKNRLQELKDKAMTDDFETGYKMNNSGIDQFDYEIREGESGQLGLDPGVGENEEIDGFIHNHINDSENRDISIFSPHDLYTLYNWLKNDNIRDRGSFVFVVTTSQGTTYALRIKSKSKLLAFGDAALEGLQNEDNNSLPREYSGHKDAFLKNTGGIQNGNTNSLNEKNFLKMLDFANAGLQTFKSDANFENWEELEYDPNTDTVTPNPCN